ncbi:MULTISPECIES: FAD binding domain-containing protein [Fischerella]|uniref:Carbon monoxide dehydrogenase n=1 Tax=Fischerella muscicola CCMEE 5323 TaxID=2019572 RepID=A0A2N6K717_FISMU|nr:MULTISPECIES: FAD binding domain-containing protein [Fischerella]MBD2430513.1 FAD binding domain-containing protein [Fischerella sp. FACHB-380]PLZ92852.1 carbon monoxide dehydrogenase [Fischerella muscicola CCMEE 5323]
MDLPNIETYLRPNEIQTINNWGKDWAWLAGGTWLFSEPQPQLRVLVDMQSLDWSEIEVQEDNLVIGATCPLIKLLQYPWQLEWTAVAGLKSAVSTLAASLKVINMATVGGNLCLALSVGSLAPIMIALGAKYEIWNLQGESRLVAAEDFQIGSRQTILQPSEVLRRVLIPVKNLKWRVNYQRFGIAATDPALAIVVSAYNPENLQFKCVIGASVPAPKLLDCNHINIDYSPSLQKIEFINSPKASATYRREITQILIKRSLHQLKLINTHP